jgi:Uma2 family endonuclease
MPALALVTDQAPVVEGPPQGHWTAEDWAQLAHDEDIRYEIIEGVLYMSKSPSAFHQWIIASLYGMMGQPARDAGFAYPFFAPIGLFMPGCDPAQPDFVVVLKSRADADKMIRERGIYGVPDLIVEVLSPGTASYDETVKRDAYERAGVPEYVVILPKERKLRYRRFQADGKYAEPVLFGAPDTFAFACLPQFPFRISALFAGMPDIGE